MSLANLVAAFKTTFGLLGKTADEQATNLANNIVENLEPEDIGAAPNTYKTTVVTGTASGASQNIDVSSVPFSSLVGYMLIGIVSGVSMLHIASNGQTDDFSPTTLHWASSNAGNTRITAMWQEIANVVNVTTYKIILFHT